MRASARCLQVRSHKVVARDLGSSCCGCLHFTQVGLGLGRAGVRPLHQTACSAAMCAHLHVWVCDMQPSCCAEPTGHMCVLQSIQATPA